MNHSRIRKLFCDNKVCENVHSLRFYGNPCENVHISLIGRKIPTIVIALVSGFLLASACAAQDLISVPAEFVRELKLPGAMNNFQRPARILMDNKAGEIYIADAGNDRIIVLDQNGMYKFEFATSEQCGAPIDIAVDSSGHIFVLGVISAGQGIFEYDYNGLFLRQFTPDSLISKTQIVSIALDSQDRLYAIDGKGKRIIRLSADGMIDKEFPATPNLESNFLKDVSFGVMAISADTIYLPVSSLGTIFCLDLEGNKIREIGYFGTNVGELNFPVAVSVTKDRMILVLDKHRYDVACFTPDGTFLGEFGGKGISPGWFYHPNWLAVDGNGLVYVGQIFNNKIQVCRMPAPILERRIELQNGIKENEKSLNGSDKQTGQILDNRSWDELTAIRHINQHFGGILNA